MYIISGGQIECVSRLTGATGPKEASSRWPQDMVNSCERMATIQRPQQQQQSMILPFQVVRVGLPPPRLPR